MDGSEGGIEGGFDLCVGVLAAVGKSLKRWD